MTPHPVVIVGAGISGLAAAWELRARGLSPLIVEAGPRAGGVIVTERAGGFVIDGGPDALLVQKPAAVALCRELGLGDRLIPTCEPRTAFVLRAGRLVPLPEASFLGLPTRVAPFLTTPLFSWRAKLRLGLEPWRRRGDGGDESIGHFIRRRFGDEAVRYIAEPLLAGIHAGDVEKLSIQSLFPRLVELEQSHGSVTRGLRGSLPARSAMGAFVSLPDGLAELPETLARALGHETFRYRARVAQISGAGPYRLTLESDEALYARAVIVTAPAWAAAGMFRSLDLVLAGLCADIPYASTATVVLALARDQIAHPMRGTGFVVPASERRRLKAATWVSSKWPHRAPEGQALLRAFLGGAGDPGILEHADATLTSMALEELRPMLGITGEPHLTRVFRWPRATPQYLVGHAAKVAAIDDRLARLPGVRVTGSGYRGTGLPDCIADARATAAAVAAFLAAGH